MTISKRIGRLDSNVFHRNDTRKNLYELASLSNKSFPLIDLSLGSTDLLPPEILLKTIRQALNEPENENHAAIM